jgi:hypothetical protein
MNAAHRRSILIPCAVGAIAAFWSASSAMAQPAPDEVRWAAMESEAQVLCASGKAEEGAILLAKLYVETGDTTWIFNGGRCYEENGLWDEAISRFEQFLRKKDPIVEEKRAATEQRIESLRARIAAERFGKVEATSALAAARPESATAQPAHADLTTPAASPQGVNWAHWQDWSWQKKAGVAGVAAGGVSLILGATFHILRELYAAEFRNAPCWVDSLDLPGCQGKYDAVTDAETGMLLGYVAAAVLGGTGTYLLLTSPDEPSAREERAGNGRTGIICGPGTTATSFGCGGTF